MSLVSRDARPAPCTTNDTIEREEVMVEIRPAHDGDLEDITDIINALLATTTYEWTDAPHTVDERRAWLARMTDAGHPVFVAVDDGAVVGWSSYADFRDTVKWPGYLGTVELTIHVREAAWGRGVGRRLIDALVAHARDRGKRVMIAAIDGENEPSIRFHARLGFDEVGRLPGVGEKFGRRLDLVLMQRTLHD
jgi:phosphinothricin acetyltransferase